MLDIIIPSYNDEPGLYLTLLSLGVLEDIEHKVYIVDDCSPNKIDYDSIIELFSRFHPIELIQLDENQGPGMARQTGFDKSSGDLVVFIDCGDEVTNTTFLKQYVTLMKNNPKVDMVAAPHFEERPNYEVDMALNIHNRMHGKIYRRSFLEKYGIKFVPECSRANEDIGFNVLCRLVLEHYNPEGLVPVENPFICWRMDMNSIVRRDNGAFYFKEQNIGLAKNAEYVISSLLKIPDFPQEIVLKYMYEVLVSLYVFFSHTYYDRPEFIKDSLRGARHFYDLYFHVIDINSPFFVHLLNRAIKEEYYDERNPLAHQLNPLTFLDFIKMVEEVDND